ncbi:transposase [Bradyrhizobium sp. Arg816]|uniref:transposase n=1 Tax=Bradyrhizobium sp. Arg816 TaxID=2998491 RepID=UPI00249F5710|nr:transposase [Bradyrhizobium sp. Arg816]MDI3567170.1 transposase [Bradyrhizobium sp. Arg816]
MDQKQLAPLRQAPVGSASRPLRPSAIEDHDLIAALRYDRISAPWVIDGPINGELFALCVEKVWAPTLAPGEIVLLDNLGSHKGKAARQTIRARGAHRIFLPPYSPDLNPIEQVFARLKTPHASCRAS